MTEYRYTTSNKSTSSVSDTVNKAHSDGGDSDGGVEKSAKLEQMKTTPTEPTPFARFLRQEPDKLSKRDLLESYHENPAFFTVANKITNDIAATSWKATDRDTRKEDVEGSQLQQIAQEPCPDYMSGVQFWKVMSMYVECVGEAFAIIDDEPDDPTRPFDLIPVPPTSVQLEQSGEDKAFWRVDFNSFQRKVPQSHMWHLKNPHTLNPFGRGRGMGHAVASEIEIENYAARHEASELYNHARPDIIVRGIGMSEDERQRLKTTWTEKFGGPDRRGMPLFSNSESAEGGGDLQIHELSRPLKELGLTELRAFSQEVIRQTFGIPPEVLGIVENSNRATITQAQKIYAENVLVPRLEAIVSSFSRSIRPFLDAENEYLDYKSPVPQDIELRREMMKDHPQAFKVNEVREVAGVEPLDDERGEQLLDASQDNEPEEQQRHISCGHLVKKKSKPHEKIDETLIRSHKHTNSLVN